MHHNAATAMAQRADMLRGLSPRESSLALNYAAGPRGGWAGPQVGLLVVDGGLSQDLGLSGDRTSLLAGWVVMPCR